MDVINFLQEKFETGAQWSTLRVYVAAIGAFHPAFRHSPLGATAEVKAFLKGVFRKRPPVKPIVPRWDLGVVLTALGQPPFESANSVPWELWTLKTIFLVAITSAARVSELQALDSAPDMLVLHRGRAILIPNRAFIPKVPTAQNVNRRIELAAFYPEPENSEQRHLHYLCPVRALRYYLSKTAAIRVDRQLFVSFAGRTLGKKVSAQTLSRWIRKLICQSYQLMGRDIPVQDVRAHSTRAMAASLADLMGTSVEDLCAAATWSSNLVFAKHYRLDFAAKRGIAAQVLAAATAALQG